MAKRYRWAVAAAAVVLATGCGGPRPVDQQGPVCRSMEKFGHLPVRLPDLAAEFERAPSVRANAGPISPSRAAFRAKIAAEAEQRRKAGPDETTHVLSVSAGGAWGAFSLGFLEAWGQNEGPDRRPQFDVVTGVSTGSMIAPVLFVGDPGKIAKLRDFYANATDDTVFSKRSVFSLLSAPSIYDTGPLREKVTAMLDDQMIEAIARAHGQRTLAVMATNLDSGEAEVFDLTSIAADRELNAAERRRRVIDAVMASAALPIGFTPVFIDGNVYVDGGVRKHVFFTDDFLDALSSQKVDLTVVVSGDLAVGRDCTGRNKYDLVAIAKRTASIAIDQLLKTSVEALLEIGARRGNRARYVDARSLIDYGAKEVPPGWPPQGPCQVSSDNDDVFNPAFQRCLADGGRRMGLQVPIPWSLEVRGGPQRPIITTR